MFLKFWILLSFIVCSSVSQTIKSNSTPNSKVECSPRARSRADKCADKLWFVGKRSRPMPENSSQLDKFCRQTSSLVTCVKTFTDRCAETDIEKQTANVMLFSMRTISKSYCTQKIKQEEALTMGPCGNAARAETAACMDQFLLTLGNAPSAAVSHRIPRTCCAFHDLKRCIIQSAQKVGQPKCDQKSIDAFDRYITSLSGNVVNLMCSEYEEDSDACQRLPSIQIDTQRKAKSIILGFGAVLKSI